MPTIKIQPMIIIVVWTLYIPIDILELSLELHGAFYFSVLLTLLLHNSLPSVAVKCNDGIAVIRFILTIIHSL